MTSKPPMVPMAIIACVDHRRWSRTWLVMRSSFGVLLRGVGGNPRSVERAGWSLLGPSADDVCAGRLFGVLAGMALVGLTTSADANIALRYTLLSIAGVILGGGEFVGGRVSPVGAVIGALTLTLSAPFLTFLKISPDWQIGAQGVILIVVLALARRLQPPTAKSGRSAKLSAALPQALDLVLRRPALRCLAHHGASHRRPQAPAA